MPSTVSCMEWITNCSWVMAGLRGEYVSDLLVLVQGSVSSMCPDASSVSIRRDLSKFLFPGAFIFISSASFQPRSQSKMEREVSLDLPSQFRIKSRAALAHALFGSVGSTCCRYSRGTNENQNPLDSVNRSCLREPSLSISRLCSCKAWSRRSFGRRNSFSFRQKGQRICKLELILSTTELTHRD